MTSEILSFYTENEECSKVGENEQLNLSNNSLNFFVAEENSHKMDTIEEMEGPAYRYNACGQLLLY